VTVTKILARDHGKTWSINTGTVDIPAWTPIKSLNSWAHSPSTNQTDTTDFDDDGRLSHLVASRGDEFTLTGSYLEDIDTGARDPGQEAVETLAAQVGNDCLKQFKLTSPGGITKTFMASAECTIGGGGNDDKSAWEAKLTVSGAITTATT
jgi:hypothetical protein